MSNQLINIIIIIGITVAITAVTILLYFSLRKRKYDTERHKALLDEIRYSLEKQMYVLTDRLMKNEERWRDVNHLLLRKEYTDDRPIFTKKRPILNDFLVANGIREQDLTVDKDLIFVLTPFHPNYFEDYDTIRKICLDVGFDCKRGDEDYHPSDIFPEMLKLITKANLIIANVNGRNPNVLYELGIAQALDKPVILIAKNTEDIPIDIKSKRFLIYSDLKDLENLLK